jgi:nitroreductase
MIHKNEMQQNDYRNDGNDHMSSQFFSWIQNRRSIKAYSDKQVPEALLLRILKAGCWAPSSHNSQPWRFIVIQETAQLKKLAKAMASRWN